MQSQNPSSVTFATTGAVEAEAATTGARLLVDALHDERVDVVFGYPGGAIMAVYDALVVVEGSGPATFDVALTVESVRPVEQLSRQLANLYDVHHVEVRR